MASLGRIVSTLAQIGTNLVRNSPVQTACGQCQGLLNNVTTPWQPVSQIRTRYINWRMWRDVKRRRLTKEHASERIRYVALKKNNILPLQLRETLTDEINAKLPRDAHPTRIVDRCAVTSRRQGLVPRWRLHRMTWRHLADYNRLSGVIRARW